MIDCDLELFDTGNQIVLHQSDMVWYNRLFYRSTLVTQQSFY